MRVRPGTGGRVFVAVSSAVDYGYVVGKSNYHASGWQRSWQACC